MIVEVVVDRTLPGASVALSGVKGLDVPNTLRFADRTASVDHVVERKPPARHASTRTAVSPRLSLSPALAETLRFPAHTSIGIDAKRATWRLGPCLALYVEAGTDRARRFGEQTRLLQDMAGLAEVRGVDLVVVEPGFMKNQVGWRFDAGRSRWQRSPVPLPDIVIRRSGSFQRGHFQTVRTELDRLAEEKRLHSLPARCTNKYAFYRLLQSVPELKSAAPFSTRAVCAQDVYKAVQRRGDVYVKPLSGAQGASVMHLTSSGRRVTAWWHARQRSRIAAVNTQSVGKPQSQIPVCVRHVTLNSEAAFRRFWRRTGLGHCVVQDTVHLTKTAEGQPFDLRWLVQCASEPMVVARVARLGSPGAVTTNIHTGGRAMDAQEVVSARFGASKAEQFVCDLDRTALRIAQELRERYGPFAEAGIDMGLEEDGRLVVFEVNPTPGRRMLRALSPAIRELSLTYLLEYAVKATGFTGKVQ